VRRSGLWPAYLVAAACFLIALISSIGQIAVTGSLRQAQLENARLSQYAALLAKRLADQRATLADIVDNDSKRYQITDGEVVARGARLYLVMNALPQPPRGKVYQAWTRQRGAQKLAPSLTFVPDRRGIAVFALPVDARNTAEIAVSTEPNGHGKTPTGALLVDLTLQ
jgi:hypothetical protein